jgi:hypothetical protein
MLKNRCFEGERLQPLVSFKINVALATEGMLARAMRLFQHALQAKLQSASQEDQTVATYFSPGPPSFHS